MFLKASAESPVFQRPVSEVRRQKRATNISACEAGASIKPGRKPQELSQEESPEPAKAGDRVDRFWIRTTLILNKADYGVLAVARCSGLIILFADSNLGFRSAPPQGGVPGRASRLGC